MRLLVVSIGRSSKSLERDLIDRYAKRIRPLAKSLGFGTLEFHSLPESQKETAAARMSDEAARLLKFIPEGALIALDERGKTLTSPAFSDLLKTSRDNQNGIVTFAIGGPDGLDEKIRKQAHFVLGFGAMTWPHQLVCAMLSEQIYRGLTLLAGHPYHRV
ncbi:MAG: 23S rRNA (pseudouridine(1915)-N(3))-methyltransferase RlmH [Pseudomonadota bacterium]